jgi:NADH-quinone oxidoreductase chain G
MDKIKLTIDGREVTTTVGKTILDAAQDNGIDIPTFCWHAKLKSIGACRVCLVEVEGWPKLQVSCATQASDGMIVHVNNERVTKARQAVIEFILLNHPLDCPTCDKGGECALQNITFKYGVDSARTVEPRQRFIVDENSTFDDLPIGPEIIRNQNRCIHCYRCTRIVEEICEEDDLGAFNRGHGTEILPPPGREIRNIYSGNVVENCPVGALTNRDWRYKIRVWRTKQKKTVCNFCSDNCNLTAWVDRDHIFRCTSRRNDRIDEGFICDIGRYGYQYVQHPDRLKSPMIRKGGELVDCTWAEAYDAIAKKIASISEKLGPQGIAALVGKDNSNEDYYILSRFMRTVVGSNSIDHRLSRKKKLSYSDDVMKLGITESDLSFDDLEKYDRFVIIGCDLHSENPITALRLLKAKRNNSAEITLLNPAPTGLSRSGNELIYGVDSEIDILTGLTRYILQERLSDGGGVLDSGDINAFCSHTAAFSLEHVSRKSGIAAEGLKLLAQAIAKSENTLFIIGSQIARHYQRDTILKAIFNLALVIGNPKSEHTPILLFQPGANRRGCRIFGMEPDRLPLNRAFNEKDSLRLVWKKEVPDREGADTLDILRQINDSKVELAFVVGADPLTVYPDADFVGTSLCKLDTLVVADLYLTETAKAADIVLPMSSCMETSGSFCNWENRIQIFEQVIKPVMDSKPVWRIFADLAAVLDADFGLDSSEAVFDEFSKLMPDGLACDFASIPEEGLRLKTGAALDRSAGLQAIVRKEPEVDSDQGVYLLSGNGDHHLGRNRTTRSDSLNRFMSEPFIGLSERTAADLALSEGDLARIENKSGKLIGTVKYIAGLRDDVVWIPDNFPEMSANVLRSRKYDIDMVTVVKV